MATVRIAVIGAGLIGRKHMEILRSGGDEYSLAAVVDPSPQVMLDAKLHNDLCYSRVDEMLDKVKPDGVVIAVPNQLHTVIGLECIAMAIPILVEKPIADSVPSALKLVSEASRMNVPILVGHHRRHNTIMRKAMDIIHTGGIGRVVAVNALWLSHKPSDYFDVKWRREKGGGPVLINAIHDVDCLRMLCGDVESVQAIASTAIRSFNVEDTAAANLRFKSGALGTLIISDAVSSPWSWEWTSGENSFYPHEPQDCYFVAGTQGSLAIPSLTHRWHDSGQESWGVPLHRNQASTILVEPLVEQMRHFVRVIRKIEAPLLCGLDGTLTLATTLAIQHSATLGKLIKVDELMGQP